MILVTHESDIAAMTNRIIRLKDGIIEKNIYNGDLKKFRQNNNITNPNNQA
jgi:putative ABC transport system ATP-binding protein